MDLVAITTAEFPLLHTVFICLLKCCQTVSIQANFFHARCLPHVDFSVCNVSEKQVQSPPIMRSEKMRFAHLKKLLEQLLYDDLVPPQSGTTTGSLSGRALPQCQGDNMPCYSPPSPPQLQSAHNQ